jgi:RimJ/RimL family protein N-acetyltransferase
MADYPAHLSRERRLADGRTVIIRPIRADDEPKTREFFASLSGNARYLRFQKWVEAVSDKLIHFFTHVDYNRHMAFVCAVREGEGEELAGEARYVAHPDGRGCEFGVVIADSWHKSGIAGLLMDALIRSARANGLETMEGLVLHGNQAMLRFVRALGFEIFPVEEDATTVRVVKKLWAEDRPRIRRPAPARAAAPRQSSPPCNRWSESGPRSMRHSAVPRG